MRGGEGFYSVSSVEVSAGPHGTIVRVEGFGALAGNLRVDSCNTCQHPPPDSWAKATRDEVAARLAGHGAENGRVLFASAIQSPSRLLVPAALMTLHLGDELVRALHVGHAIRAGGYQTRFSTSLLVSCASKVAELHGCNRLELLLHNDRAVRLFREFGFRKLGRRDHA